MVWRLSFRQPFRRIPASMATPMLLYGRKHQTGLNWITAIAMTGFHVGAVAALFYMDAGAMLAAFILYYAGGMLGIGMGYHRLLDASRVQDAEVGRVLPDLLRDPCARRRSDLLGGHASHPSSEVRSGRRPAYAARRHVVGAHGLDPAGRRAASRRLGAGALRSRPQPRPRSCAGSRSGTG